MTLDQKIDQASALIRDVLAQNGAPAGVTCSFLTECMPLVRGLADYRVWFTALRRDQSPTRANLQPIDPDNPRSGRWAGQKLECGIHVQSE